MAFAAGGPPRGLGERTEWIVNRGLRLGEPSSAYFGHMEVIFEPDAEAVWNDDHWLVREAHAWLKHGAVTLHQVRRLVDREADPVPGAVRQARQPIAGT